MTHTHDECFKFASENDYVLVRYAQGDWQARDAELIFYLGVSGKPPLVGIGLTERAVNCLRRVERETRGVSPTVSQAATIIRIAAGRHDVPCAAFAPANDALELQSYLRWLESVIYPVFPQSLINFKGGLLPTRDAESSRMNLVVKTKREIAATARLRKYFRFYLVPLRAGDVNTFGLATAFFDDDDEPLVIRTPLFNDPIVQDFVQVLSSESFDVYFFDDHSRVLAGFRAENPDAMGFRHFADAIQFVPGTLELSRQFDDHMISWFGARSSAEDDASLRINLPEMLTPDILREEGQNAPGTANERDIEMALHRAFVHNDVHRNPMRADNGREFVDVLVVTKEAILLIQAKDSPITEAILDRTIDRKMSTTAKHVSKAISQLRGSISQLQSSESIEIITDGHTWELSVSGREVFGLVIVKELFDGERCTRSRPVLDIFEGTGVPCLLLDYMDFQELTHFRSTEESFLGTLNQTFAVACDQGLFARLRFGLVARGPTVHSIRSSTVEEQA